VLLACPLDPFSVSVNLKVLWFLILKMTKVKTTTLISTWMENFSGQEIIPKSKLNLPISAKVELSPF
jgi:hypothetical protein